MKRITVPANDEDPAPVIEFIEEELDGHDYSARAFFHLQVAIEEVFVNIVRHSGLSPEGVIEVCFELLDDPLRAVVRILDGGVPFNPLASDDPDISPEGLMDREGGLGVFMVRNLVDDVSYARENGKNVLTFTKTLG